MLGKERFSTRFGSTLSRILVGLEKNDVDLGYEETGQVDGGTDVDAHAESRYLDLPGFEHGRI